QNFVQNDKVKGIDKAGVLGLWHCRDLPPKAFAPSYFPDRTNELDLSCQPVDCRNVLCIVLPVGKELQRLDAASKPLRRLQPTFPK
ncbi:MAG: hypothetical protein ACNA7J_12945, partial [Wenzhouxiangella sp.]